MARFPSATVGERIDEPQDEIKGLRWIGHVDDLGIDFQFGV